eukprot:CAMPEP_0201283354 /NCGR_PEP_ID=MMETSP1317-20130820/8349_1 /ASSEMBLY_ACC=CAM_ASM_000770 /TAXON_ID=187299 /ORGANISM="Undescribed Undescribed, Strain Undescribed" /LENGTH=91 /DNA_ID=CAMNT_0047599349 /DNA_START=578 /DNA_END=850 /DNA_ORIENTATION=-
MVDLHDPTPAFLPEHDAVPFLELVLIARLDPDPSVAAGPVVLEEVPVLGGVDCGLVAAHFSSFVVEVYVANRKRCSASYQHFAVATISRRV